MAKAKMLVTVFMEIESDKDESTDELVQRYSAETHYDFPDTDDIIVTHTSLIDVEIQ